MHIFVRASAYQQVQCRPVHRRPGQCCRSQADHTDSVCGPSMRMPSLSHSLPAVAEMLLLPGRKALRRFLRSCATSCPTTRCSAEAHAGIARPRKQVALPDTIKAVVHQESTGPQAAACLLEAAKHSRLHCLTHMQKQHQHNTRTLAVTLYRERSAMQYSLNSLE